MLTPRQASLVRDALWILVDVLDDLRERPELQPLDEDLLRMRAGVLKLLFDARKLEAGRTTPTFLVDDVG